MTTQLVEDRRALLRFILQVRGAASTPDTRPPTPHGRPNPPVRPCPHLRAGPAGQRAQRAASCGL